MIILSFRLFFFRCYIITNNIMISQFSSNYILTKFLYISNTYFNTPRKLFSVELAFTNPPLSVSNKTTHSSAHVHPFNVQLQTFGLTLSSSNFPDYEIIYHLKSATLL